MGIPADQRQVRFNSNQPDVFDALPTSTGEAVSRGFGTVARRTAQPEQRSVVASRILQLLHCRTQLTTDAGSTSMVLGAAAIASLDK